LFLLTCKPYSYLLKKQVYGFVKNIRWSARPAIYSSRISELRDDGSGNISGGNVEILKTHKGVIQNGLLAMLTVLDPMIIESSISDDAVEHDASGTKIVIPFTFDIVSPQPPKQTITVILYYEKISVQ
jgi:hypothetical protein